MRWRKAWARNWPAVRFCSDACRQRKVTSQDRDLESAIISLLDQRTAGATICPSEAARLVAGESGWRDLMEPARRAARRLVAAQEVEITQGGRVVDPSSVWGPIRIRRKVG